jgi:hypothetical protein
MTRTRQTPNGRRRLPAVSRRQLRARVRDLKDARRHDKHQLDGAGHLIEGQRLRIEELEAKVARYEADRVDLSVLRRQLEAAESANRKLREANTALAARAQNAEAISVPPAIRDTTNPDDQQTEPIYVGAWRDWLARRAVSEATPEVKPLPEALGAAS